ncbi:MULTISPECIES: flagellar transcriptional regulator FlhC [Nitrosomonas]|uniref:Flagellar transcriptional regulator FlhC n=2 Tax=Nitrosomonas eutropha TaxID=916 RepID=FLHC_NITEC|nr:MULTISPECIES: flagellar transcriptional regulator FlhC [Nitrosomonas]Q0AI30.1 RecName: Full=Flagellar transcriptional regulator FlhC [Nitrosomonas eutropha C91]ABI59002.1 Flagellar transcriptional activator, FlhC subunit [Nitrosomonas eutropha C91]MXS80828.1 flagellar transcriptional regulator FlhC [Nitrosomonas sp. GH22]PXV82231.1 flagellar transcriptional activator FlhC [Nitrosomonas eutropha]SCX24706.1 flagellar transcriptional activator FlhC [Nitrosomonas eutropha]SDW42292.1 flagellar 
MKVKSILSEGKQIQLATELVRLGARLQVLEVSTTLSRERLVKLYKEVKGVSPPKGMLPYSEDWFTGWQPNMHSSLFINIYNYITQYTNVRDIDAIIKSYQLYLEHIEVNHLQCILSFTRAWTLVRFVESKVLSVTSCVKCTGNFLVHSLDIQSNHVCGLCHVPSRAGKTKRAAAQKAKEAQEVEIREACAV